MRKINLTLFLVLFTLIQCFQSVVAQDNELDNLLLKGKNILIVHGGWDGHSPTEFAAKMQSWFEEEGATVSLSDSLGIYTDVEFLKEQDLIVQAWTMDKISDEQLKGLVSAVKSGVGLAGCHGGIGDSFREAVDFQYMVGCQWVAHPGGQIDYSVQIRDKKDDVTKGISDFNVHSEQYYVLVDPNVKVLATTTFSGENDPWIEGSVMPVVWKKYHGEGRIFYFSVGHNMADYDIPESWLIIQRGFRWASESKYQPKEDCIHPVYK